MLLIQEYKERIGHVEKAPSCELTLVGRRVVYFQSVVVVVVRGTEVEERTMMG